MKIVHKLLDSYLAEKTINFIKTLDTSIFTAVECRLHASNEKLKIHRNKAQIPNMFHYFSSADSGFTWQISELLFLLNPLIDIYHVSYVRGDLDETSRL